MNRKILLCCAVAAWALTIVVICWLQEAGAEVGLVSRVKDGDTLAVRIVGGEETAVRLYGIDAPEKRQPFGPEAWDHLVVLASGKEVVLERVSVDRYGRLVAIVEVGGERLQSAMVAAGWAWVYGDYCRDGPYCRELTRLEGEARAAGRGLWAQPEPTPPWEYRKLSKEARASQHKEENDER